jgi:hypothetical protein
MPSSRLEQRGWLGVPVCFIPDIPHAKGLAGGADWCTFRLYLGMFCTERRGRADGPMQLPVLKGPT